MKTRILSAAIGLVLLLAVVFLGREVFGAAIFVLSLFSIHEFFNAISNRGFRPVRFIGYFACLPLLALAFYGSFTAAGGPFDVQSAIKGLFLLIFITLVLLFILIVFMHSKYNISDISLTFFAIFYIVFLFSFVTLTRRLDNGNYYIWLIFIGAWATDTCAYFSGVFLGKTKLLPAISPKKTLEGSIGGSIGCVLIMVLFGILFNQEMGNLSIYHFAVMGLLCGIISQVGDWAASAIKRFVDVKDYGNIMPGHGGVLDRFDSILFIAPVIYFYISFIII